MLRKICYREGIGDLIADGLDSCASHLGHRATESLTTLGGSPILASDPRSGSLSEALGILVNPRGGDDLNSTHTVVDTVPQWARSRGWTRGEFLRWWSEWLDMPSEVKTSLFGDPPSDEALDPRNPQGKPELVSWYAKLVALYDSLGLCMFPIGLLGAWGPTHMASLCSSFIGTEYSPTDALATGERVAALMRCFSLRFDEGERETAWPTRFYQEALDRGPAEGGRLSRRLMTALVRQYYRRMQWDEETGRPKPETLQRLGLGFLVDDNVRKAQ